MAETSGLLPQMKDVMKGRHGSLTTYQATPMVGMEACLSFSCKSLNSLVPLPKPQDLNNTMMNTNLAKHFLLKLWKKDQAEHGDTTNLFGYAAMFQFCLDFYALAVRREDSDAEVEYPARPAKWKREQFELTKPNSEGWRESREIWDRLQHNYWRNHSLLQLVSQIKGPLNLSVEDDSERVKWVKTANVIRNCSATENKFDEEDMEMMLKVLSDAVRMSVTKLLPVHQEFQDAVNNKHKKGIGCCVVM